MNTLTLKEKKDLFLKVARQVKKRGVEGEQFIDGVYNEIERLYDVWFPCVGFTWNEQKDFDDHFNKWVKEI